MPVLTAAWLWGPWGGGAAGAVALPLHLGLAWVAGVEDPFPANGVPGHVGLVVIGVGIGLVSRRVRSELHLRREVERALRESEARWRTLVEHAPNIILVSDRRGNIIFINHPGAGYTFEQVRGQPMFEFIPPSEHDRVRAALARVFDHGETLMLELEVMAAGGGTAHFRSHYAPLREEGEITGAVIISSDITELKQLEAIRLRFMERVVRAQEEERRRIARELHDATGQTLTSLLIGLRVVDELPDLPAVRERLRDLRALTSQTIDEIARLAKGLHPSVLDDVGFAAALERYGAEFTETYGVRTDLQLIGISGGDRLPPAVETSLYRITQEALTNVAKHARATTVSLIVERQHGSVRAIIEDDGQGFELDDTTGMPDGVWGLGLLGIRERAELLGGNVTVETSVGAGTTLYVTIPLHAGARGGVSRAASKRR